MEQTGNSFGFVSTEVGINNNSTYITGIGAEAGSSYTGATTNSYDTAFGMRASTTKNIYGIYDMSGGTWEYVMGTKNKTLTGTGFNSLPNEKYYNNYTTSSYQGHALTETQGWYQDIYQFDRLGWFMRGSLVALTTQMGIFSVMIESDPSSNISVRTTRMVVTNE